MRLAMQIVGGIAILMGLLWIGQGSGFIHWPASSFMIDQRPWIWKGLALAVAGAALLLVGRRQGR